MSRLLHDHLEEVAVLLNWPHPEAHKLRAAIIVGIRQRPSPLPRAEGSREDARRLGTGRIFANSSKG